MSQQLAIMTGYAMHYCLCAVWPKLPLKVKLALWDMNHKRNVKNLYH